METKLFKNQTLWMMVISVFLLSSCASSKKFDYASAYKFRTISHHEKSTEDVSISEKVDPSNLYAAIENIENEELNHEIEASQNKFLEDAGVKSEKESLSKEEIAERVNAMDKKEKRKLRKNLMSELKEEMKRLKFMEKNDITATEETADLTGQARTGIILGAAGLILVIIGGSGVLYTVGAVLVVVGLVLILIDVL